MLKIYHGDSAEAIMGTLRQRLVSFELGENEMAKIEELVGVACLKSSGELSWK